MAKTKNKGFSLIEIIIAIAILTILLTPILQQLAQTMATNRRSKEQQHATENAVYIMEYFQKADKASIDNSPDWATGSVTLNDELTCTNMNKIENVECRVYLYDPVTDSVFDTTESFEYNVYQYELEAEKIGSRQTTYTRFVVLDDLSSKLQATSFNTLPDGSSDADGLAYKIAVPSEAPTLDSASGIEDFVQSQDGYWVQYNDPDTRDYVTAIVCLSKGSYAAYKVQDPNETNLGNMHDLNADKMAIIDGDSTDADADAEKELYAKALARMKEIDPAKWQIQVSGSGTNNYLIQDGYMDGLKKLTHIYIDGVDGDDEHYRVQVLVSYKTDAGDQILEMTAFDKTFAYADCPDGPEIYFEYQPLVVDSTDWSNIEYAANEYILIDNYVENAKLYLYKPRWDADKIYEDAYTARQNYYSVNGTYNGFVYNFDNAKLNDSTDYEEHTEYRLNNDTSKKVKIYLANAVEVGEGTDKAKQLSIFTNLDIENVNDPAAQFSCVSSFGDTLFDGDLSKTEKSGDLWKSMTKTAFDETYLKYIEDDRTESDRLYTVTVKLTPDDERSNTVEITGAKGAN